jgi:hypothetical protein
VSTPPHEPRCLKCGATNDLIGTNIAAVCRDAAACEIAAAEGTPPADEAESIARDLWDAMEAGEPMPLPWSRVRERRRVAMVDAVRRVVLGEVDVVAVSVAEEGPGEWCATGDALSYVANAWGRTREIAVGAVLRALGEALDPDREGTDDHAVSREVADAASLEGDRA